MVYTWEAGKQGRDNTFLRLISRIMVEQECTQKHEYGIEQFIETSDISTMFHGIFKREINFFIHTHI